MAPTYRGFSSVASPKHTLAGSLAKFRRRRFFGPIAKKETRHGGGELEEADGKGTFGTREGLR